MQLKFSGSLFFVTSNPNLAKIWCSQCYTPNALPDSIKVLVLIQKNILNFSFGLGFKKIFCIGTCCLTEIYHKKIYDLALTMENEFDKNYCTDKF